MELYKKIGEYVNSGNYPFHMPGHKRNEKVVPISDMAGYDITEIEEFDNLHKPEGILKEAMELAAGVCHSDYAYFLVNGSTGGNLAGIFACTRRGDSVLIGRNCHKSVYNGIFLNELKPYYVYPQNVKDDEGRSWGFGGEILPEDVEAALDEHPEICLVIITSPTYEGIVSDIAGIAKAVHDRGKILMVDEAHGAHLGLERKNGKPGFFPESAITQGADIVVQSPHKTLTAYTQSGVLHLNGSLVDKKRLEMFLSILQSSSPSYILMAGLDRCYRLINEQGERLFSEYRKNLVNFYSEGERLKNLKVFRRKKKFDPSKLVIYGEGLTGMELAELLRTDFNIEVEMYSSDYILAMTGIGDRPEGFERLIEALKKIDAMIQNKMKKDSWEKGRAGLQIPEKRVGIISGEGKDTSEKMLYTPAEATGGFKRLHGNRTAKMLYTPAEAMGMECEPVKFEELKGRVAADYLYLYPPGIPIVVPGEVFDEKVLEGIREYKSSRVTVHGIDTEAMCIVEDTTHKMHGV